MRTAPEHLTENDERLAPIIAEVTLPEIHSTRNIFFDLSSCIIGQQIHYRRSVPAFQRLIAQLPGEQLTPETVLALREEDIRSLKIADAKYQTLLRWAVFWQEHTDENIDWINLNDKEVRGWLSPVKGIGPWSVDMMLIYTLERPDVFPAGDYHLKQVMTSLYELDTSSGLKTQLEEISQRWVPYRSVACRYLLTWKELLKQGLL